MSEKAPPSQPTITVPYDQFQISGITYWIEANGYKPHILVDTRFPGIRLPPQCMVKEQEVLNIHSKATGKFNWADDRMEFNARFGGREFHLIVPYHAILAINFAGTGQWIPMPWTALREASGREEVQITAVSETTPVEQVSALDGVDEATLVKPQDVLGEPSAVPGAVHGMEGATVTTVDFRSRTRVPK